VQVLNFVEIAKLSGHTDKIFSIKWSNDSKQLVSAAYDKTLRKWDINSGNQISSSEVDFERTVSPNLEFKNECYDKIFCFKNYFQVEVYSVANKCLNYLRTTSDVKLTKWSPDSSKLAIVLDNKQLLIWNWQQEKVFDCKCRLFKCRENISTLHNIYENNDTIKRLEWSPDGNEIAVISQTGIVRIWDIATREYVQLDSLISGLAWSPDGRFIALAVNDKPIKIIDSLAYSEIKIFNDLEESIRLLSWSNNSKFLASVNEHNVILWNAQTGQILHTCNFDGPRISLVVWSPCDKYIALCCYRKNKIWIFRTN
jgi:WD40 repeat protein